MNKHIEWLQNNNKKGNRLFTRNRKYVKVKSINTQNDYETASKKWTDT